MSENYSKDEFSIIESEFSLDQFDLKEDQNGYLKLSGKIMKEGDLVYPDFVANISKDELRKARKTVDGSDITLRHPEDMVDPSNYDGLTVGNIVNSSIKSFDGVDWIYGDFVFKKQDAIDLIKQKKSRNEKVYVSSGYYRKKYSMDSKTAVFKDIAFNHVAVDVHTPRATGASLDSSDSEKNKTNKGLKMKYKKTLQKNEDFSLDELDVEYDEAHESLVKAFLRRESSLIENANKSLAEMKSSKDSIEGAKQALESKVEELEKQLKESISMDELEEYEKVKARAIKYGVTESFKNIKDGKGLILKARYNKSFDEAHIEGAYSTLPEDDDEYMSKKAKSNAALENPIKDKSMDSKVVPFSQMNPYEYRNSQLNKKA